MSRRDSVTLRGVSIASGRDLDLSVEDTIIAEPTTVRGVTRFVNRLYAAQSNGFSGVGWIIDDDIPVCMVCGREFGFFFRRHHCRSCGDLVCYLCSPDTAVIHEMQELGPQRVCVQCNWGQEEVHAARCRPLALTRPETGMRERRETASFSSSSTSSDGFVGGVNGPPSAQAIDSDDDMTVPPKDNSGIEVTQAMDAPNEPALCAPHDVVPLLFFLHQGEYDTSRQEERIERTYLHTAACSGVISVPAGCQWGHLRKVLCESALYAGLCPSLQSDDDWELFLVQEVENEQDAPPIHENKAVSISVLSVAVTNSGLFWALAPLAVAVDQTPRKGFLLHALRSGNKESTLLSSEESKNKLSLSEDAISLLMSLNLSRGITQEGDECEADGVVESIEEETVELETKVPLRSAKRVSVCDPSRGDILCTPTSHRKHSKISDSDLQLLNMAYTPVVDENSARDRNLEEEVLNPVDIVLDPVDIGDTFRGETVSINADVVGAAPAARHVAPTRRDSVATSLALTQGSKDILDSVVVMGDFTNLGSVGLQAFLSSSYLRDMLKKKLLTERIAIKVFENHAVQVGTCVRKELVGYKAFLSATEEALKSAGTTREESSADIDNGTEDVEDEPKPEAPEELLLAFRDLSEQTVALGRAGQGVSFSVLPSWVPLQEAISEGLLTSADILDAFNLVRNQSESSVQANGNPTTEHLSLPEFVELALLLQQTIDIAILAQTANSSSRQDAANGGDRAISEESFDIEGYSNRRLDEFLSSDTASIARRHSLGRSLSSDGRRTFLAGEAIHFHQDDAVTPQMIPHLKTCIGNLYKQGHRVKSWKLRRFVLSGLRLSYYSGKVQKGEFSLKGHQCEVHIGQAADDTTGKGGIKVTAIDDSRAGAAMHPFSFTIVNYDVGKYLNLYAETQADVKKWSDAVNFNVHLSQSLLVENGIAPTDTHTDMVQIKSEAAAEVHVPIAPTSVGSYDQPGIYARILKSDERVAMAGEVVKRNKFTRMQEVRHLVLTSPPRLLFVDISTMDMKTEVPFGVDSKGRPSTTAELAGDTSFILQTSIKGSKVYALEVPPQSAHSAQEWVAAINAASLS